MRRIIISGTHSGCGKTTITCAILAALKKRGLDVTAFKCGPDYIDPMFHKKAIGVASNNLDSFFCDKNTILALLSQYGEKTDISIIEGVMGFYDGKCGSAYSVSEMTETPVIIVIDCKGMSESIGAVIKGFLSFRSNNIAGFIFNRLPEKLIPLAEELCRELGTEYYGYFPKNDLSIESRHLGLVTADEISDIQTKIKKLGEFAEQYIHIDKLFSSCNTPLPEFKPLEINCFSDAPVIAVARDRAFCFIYQENIDLLEKMGCRIRYFSPLNEKTVPDADGLILSGGYPELYAAELSANRSMLDSIYNKIKDGIPTIAECGGFMYLHRALSCKDGAVYKMAGVIDGETFPADRLKRFGYITMTATQDSLLVSRGEKIKAHEFHYWDSSNCGNSFSAEKSDGRSWDCCHTSATLYAGFPHIYFYSDTSIAEKFVRKCIRYGEKNGQDQQDNPNR
ncbi:MAG: cobyrinate a,c-diamide synthase [Ruminococcus sp.]|nr:cobyrinate a,c-diamide synthase [Ruminococcus sp.]